MRDWREEKKGGIEEENENLHKKVTQKRRKEG